MFKRTAFILMLMPSAAFADCTCACVNGKMQGVCTERNEARPKCAQTACGAREPTEMNTMIMRPGGQPSFCKTKERINIWTGKPMLATMCM